MKIQVLVGVCMLSAACAGNSTVTSMPLDSNDATFFNSNSNNTPDTNNTTFNVLSPNATVNPNITPPVPSFLKIANQKLSLQGKPFTMVGYQAALGDVTNYCGWSGADLNAAVAEMQTGSHANTVRVWFLQSAGGPGNWAPFDTFIQQAKSHGLTIIATLVNQWGDCEPNNSAGQKNYKTLSWYQGGYKTTQDGYPLAYRDYVKAVAQRYANEPAIGVWQLVNEAEARDITNNSCPDDTAAAQAIRAFADDMVDVIHSVDGNHLINLGTQDNGYCGVSGSSYQYIHAGKIDLCEVHSYEPGNQALPSPMTALIDQCKAIGKVTFLGEVGICRNVQADGSCSGNTDASTLQRRASLFDAKFKAGLDYGLVGMLLWQWSPGQDTALGVFASDPVETTMQKY